MEKEEKSMKGNHGNAHRSMGVVRVSSSKGPTGGEIGKDICFESIPYFGQTSSPLRRQRP